VGGEGVKSSIASRLMSETCNRLRINSGSLLLLLLLLLVLLDSRLNRVDDEDGCGWC
jgi:hypothetical protein